MTRCNPLRVVQAVPPPGPQTNPYLPQLVSALRPHAEVEWFTWRRALFGRYDVLHLHWPEHLLRRRTRAATAAALVRGVALLARTALLRTAVVRTVHNERPHEDGTRLEEVVRAWWDRRTTVLIRLTPDDGAGPVVPHGHYRDWFAAVPSADPVRGRLLFFGLIRPVKGLDRLLAAFAELDDPDASLHVVGRVLTEVAGGDELATTLRRAATTDPRLGVVPGYVDDRALAAEIGAARLVVLPYTRMGNSGAALLALSLNRPVLVPDASVTRRLRDEVGPGWVRLYEVLDADVLAEALTQDIPAGRPDLDRRDWDGIAHAHVRCYREAVAVARPRRGRR